MKAAVSVLIINPVDSAAISTSVEAANAKNIPVITVDRSADKGKVVAHIASDNVKGGEMAAQLIVEKVGKAAKVAEIEGIPGASATRERGQGFHNVADKDLTVVAKQSADFDRTKGLNVEQISCKLTLMYKLSSLITTKWHWALSKQLNPQAKQSSS